MTAMSAMTAMAAAGGFAIHSARHLGPVPRHRTASWVMIGQDGGQSISLGGDRHLFVFSDTLLAALSPAHPYSPPPPPYARYLGDQGIFLANTAGIAQGTDLREALAGLRYYLDDDGFPREVLAPRPADRTQKIRFWPEHGVAIDGRVYLYYLGIQTTDPSTIWGFRNLGTGLAVLDPETGRCERLFRGGDWRLWETIGDDFHFGVQVVREGGYVYVFGSVRNGLLASARLARVPASRILEPAAYEILASPEPRWSAGFAESWDLGPSGIEFSVTRNDYLGKYLMLYVDEYRKALMARTADALWGPYSLPCRVIDLACEPETEMIYLGFEHPSFSFDGGRRIFLSYCQPRFVNNSLVTLKLR